MGVLIFQAVATGNDPRPNTPRPHFPVTVNRHGRVQRHRTRAYTVCFGHEQHYCNGCIEIGKRTNMFFTIRVEPYSPKPKALARAFPVLWLQANAYLTTNQSSRSKGMV